MTITRPLSSADESTPSREIYLQLRGLIVSGMLAANERLPTVRQTAADLGVAPGTVAKAYKLLEQEGLVITRTAAGTRVAESAAVLPHAVLKRIRELTDEALRTGAGLDDVISVLRAQWSAQTEQPPAD
ncbi:GntR family transcriptional regulator [Microbacterium arborescens]|uniref:GntR family transcriptional regulator n=1 Tax=Microbacterium arborescens TaxID=33883 RepID=UPI0025A299C0|nr:GntR family transcriptional regulator [Microbacterium arborescens]WJM14631.1 GntR family transcriptional regulator [Microbacterium arborescens]